MVRRHVLVALAVGVGVVTIFASVVVSSDAKHDPIRKPHDEYVRPLPPPVAGAFINGGTPLRDEAIEKLLVEDFTDFVLEVDSERKHGIDASKSTRKQHAAALEHAEAIAARGPQLALAWTGMLAALERWVHVPASGRAFNEVSRELRAKVRVVSDQLAAAGIGVYLEGDVISRGAAAHAIIYSYRIEQVVFVVSGRAPRRVLSLRRLDHLNSQHSLLGMQSEELGDPVLLLDQIDEHVAGTVLPVLATDSAYPLGDDRWQSDEGGQLAMAAGETIRRELAASLGDDGAAATAVASLLGERDKLTDQWRAQLGRENLRMTRTDKLFLPRGLLEKLVGHIPAKQLARVAEIERALERLDASRIASRCHDLVASTVRRHEAQHGLDDDRPADEALHYPTVLADHLGPAVDADGTPRRSIERARGELSAYLSQIANDPATPQLAVWHVARSAFHRRMAGTAESYAAVVILEGLGRQLGVTANGPTIHGGKIDRGRLLQPGLAIAMASDDQLRDAARALWRELYNEPLVAIADR